MKKLFVRLAACCIAFSGMVSASADIHRGMMLMDARTAMFKAGWHKIILHK